MRESRAQRLLASIRRLRCPSTATVAAFLDGNLDAEEERRARAHFAACPDCSLLVAELQEISRASVPEVPHALLRRARGLQARAAAPLRFGPGWRLAGALALSGAALLTGLWLGGPGWFGPRPGAEAVRTVRGAPSETSAPAIISPLPGEDLREPAVRFEWTRVPEAVAYEIVVVDAQGGVVERIAPGKALSASPGFRPRPGTYFVSVAAVLPDGRKEKSGFRRFTIGRER